MLYFSDIEVKRKSPSLLEVTLFDGIIPKTYRTKMTYAHPSEKKSDNPGITIAGYLVSKDSRVIKLSWDKLPPNELKSYEGLVVVHKNSIYRIILQRGKK